jgi:hypothetical protein
MENKIVDTEFAIGNSSNSQQQSTKEKKTAMEMLEESREEVINNTAADIINDNPEYQAEMVFNMYQQIVRRIIFGQEKRNLKRKIKKYIDGGYSVNKILRLLMPQKRK